MTSWTESGILQALGWATLNSFWQMGLLWGIFSLSTYLFNFSSFYKYRLALAGLFLGFGGFVYSFISHTGSASSASMNFGTEVSASTLQTIMLCASVTYLSLLVFPTFRLLQNWRFVQAVRQQTGKATWQHRLFVQTVASRLGIGQQVKLVVSDMITSPLTIGYLKPIILLPIAAMNGLTPSQVEAILLHELSHIRRWDYFYNLVVSFIQTVLYFNPFVKSFAAVIDSEREACCDATVLQFGYNPHEYASALLHLQKNASRPVSLALAAAGKGQLLSRIEKIMGMEKKKTFRLVQALPLLLASLCIIAFNSILIIEDAASGQPMAYTEQTVFNPWNIHPTLQSSAGSPSVQPADSKPEAIDLTAAADPMRIEIVNLQPSTSGNNSNPVDATVAQAMPVAFDESDAQLSVEEKAEVKKTVQDAKKALTELQWKEVEKNIADAMNEKEKSVAKQEFVAEVNKVNWQALEQNLKANYDKLDWNAVQISIGEAMQQVRLDSIQNVYHQALAELNNLQRQLKTDDKLKASPLPDVSKESLRVATQSLRSNLDSLKAVRSTKKVIHL